MPHGLVRIYFLRFSLPSKYLLQRVKVEYRPDGSVEEVRMFSSREIAAAASRLEGIRRRAYEMINGAFVYVEGYGMWIAVSMRAVKLAHEVSEYVQREINSIPVLKKARGVLPRYEVKAIPVYLEVEEAKRLLEEAKRLLEEEIRELQEKIAEAEFERKKAAARKLAQRLEKRIQLLRDITQYLEKIKNTSPQ